jgi:hypothetical protein
MSSSFVSPAAVRAPRLLDQLRDAALHRFGRPEPAERYAGRARRYILFHGKRHPRELGECEVRQFLEHVAKSEKNPVTCLEQAREAPPPRSPKPGRGFAPGKTLVVASLQGISTRAGASVGLSHPGGHGGKGTLGVKGGGIALGGRTCNGDPGWPPTEGRFAQKGFNSGGPHRNPACEKGVRHLADSEPVPFFAQVISRYVIHIKLLQAFRLGKSFHVISCHFSHFISGWVW